MAKILAHRKEISRVYFIRHGMAGQRLSKFLPSPRISRLVVRKSTLERTSLFAKFNFYLRYNHISKDVGLKTSAQ